MKNFTKLHNKAKKIIPGVSQLLGKRPEMYLPGNKWPTYYSKAKGVTIWGLDGKNILISQWLVLVQVYWYSDNDMNKIAINAIKSGSMTTLNAPEDVRLAEELLKIHPWANSVKYARTGGESMSVAVRLSRAYTGKERFYFVDTWMA